MFSIIVCSVKPELAEKLRQNIEDTIGVPFEFIAFDNRGTGRGICSVYNECARRAKYDLLCFVHEDVLFRTPHWGEILSRKLAEPQCGVIGYAGGLFKTRSTTIWCTRGLEPDCRQNYIQITRAGISRYNSINPDLEDYSRVICLDGLCLMVRKEVWAQTPFDERTLTGFHAYDLDFTTAVACRYENYVSHQTYVVHFSEGSYSQQWIDGLETYHAKWRDTLPMFVGEPPAEKAVAKLELRAQALFIRHIMRERAIPPRKVARRIADFIRREPRSAQPWKLIWKFIRWRTGGNNY